MIKQRLPRALKLFIKTAHFDILPQELLRNFALVRFMNCGTLKVLTVFNQDIPILKSAVVSLDYQQSTVIDAYVHSLY